ncbi:MAG: UDP-N-acetylmuramoyl-L-alanyl-D-glutamate--2,6-diaminopimelate ligase [bacterium]
MRLRTLLDRAGISTVLADPEISSLCFDSRQASPGCLFFALPGKHSDGTSFIAQAQEKGAVAAVAEKCDGESKCPVVVVPNARIAMADLAATFFDHPDRALKCVGVTGTNGKTTTTFLIRHIFEQAGLRCGLIGTIKYLVAEEERPAPHTTPESVDIQKILAEIRESHGRAVAMEVSSHAIVQHRVRGVEFDAAIFTNLTQDHLDYHGSMDAYFEAKAGLFEAFASQKNKKGRAIVNLDDRYGQRLIDQFSKRLKIISIGRGIHAEFRASSVRHDMNGTTFTLEARGKSYLVRLPLIGLFNVYNALAAIAATVTCGVEIRTAIDALAAAPQIPGRLERIAAKRHFQVFVDYAHTDDALRNVLRTIRELNPSHVITVCGCGGDRDRAKRPLMAAAAAELSDHVIITSDNPRSENPEDILMDMESGLSGRAYEKITDRESAIRRAIDLAGPGGIVLIAGKGHEKFQEFADTKVPFDDVLVAERAITDKKGAES